MRRIDTIKIVCIIVAFFIICINNMVAQNPLEDFSGGSGTFSDPYRITTVQQLSNIRNYLGAENTDLCFKIMNDIDLSGNQWSPIANPLSDPPENAFHGKLYGDGKKLIGLNIGQGENPTVRYAGLFGVIKTGAVIDNVNLVGGNIKTFETSSAYTGSIAAYADERVALSSEPSVITISNCYSSINIAANGTNANDIGGIIGRNHNIGTTPRLIITNFINCRYEGNISALGSSNIGGILGNNSSFDGADVEINFTGCSNTGNLSSIGTTSNVGGLFGNMFLEGPVSLNFNNCYNTGNLMGGTDESYTGGLVGYCRIYGNASFSMLNCYSYSMLGSPSNCVGGLVGYFLNGDNATNIEIKNSYAAGSILGSAQYAGGIVSKIDPTGANIVIENCIAAQTSIGYNNSGSYGNRIVGLDLSGITLLNNYANSDMKLNGEYIVSNNANSIAGLDKSLRDFYTISTYSENGLAWDINTNNSELWNIFEEKNLPYFSRQSAPVFISELYRDSVKFELLNASDSLVAMSIITYSELTSGNTEKAINLIHRNVNDGVVFINYEADKESSYPVPAYIQKSNITIIADDKSKCFEDDDPEFTYTVNPPLIGEDILNGDLSRQSGDNPGNYNILQGTLSNSNYEINFVGGVLSIKDLPVVDEISDMIMCIDESSEAIPLNSNISGTIFEWSGGAAIGLENGSDDSEIHPFTVTGDMPVVITVTPSIVYENLTCIGASVDFEIRPAASTSKEINEIACFIYEAPDGQEYNQSGEYTAIIPNSLGCDSIITINLTVNTIDVDVSLEDNTLIADENEAVYQWLDCDDEYSYLDNETGKIFTPVRSGNYAVEITKYGCKDTSSCTTIIINSINDSNAENIHFFPNPVEREFYVDFGSVKNDIIIDIFNQDGKLIDKYNFKNEKIVELSLPEVSGLYNVIVYIDNEIIRAFKLIKK